MIKAVHSNNNNENSNNKNNDDYNINHNDICSNVNGLLWKWIIFCRKWCTTMRRLTRYLLNIVSASPLCMLLCMDNHFEPFSVPVKPLGAPQASPIACSIIFLRDSHIPLWEPSRGLPRCMGMNHGVPRFGLTSLVLSLAHLTAKWRNCVPHNKTLWSAHRPSISVWCRWGISYHYIGEIPDVDLFPCTDNSNVLLINIALFVLYRLWIDGTRYQEINGIMASCVQPIVFHWT